MHARRMEDHTSHLRKPANTRQIKSTSLYSKSKPKKSLFEKFRSKRTSDVIRTPK
jgi:hypothetical protein